MEIPARAGGKGGKNGGGKLKWWQLSLIGVGCTIGTGYFLGSGIGIYKTGPSFIIAFILAGLTAMIVSEILGKMFIQDPQKGSFRSYTKKAFGRWAGFGSGWVYWFSENAHLWESANRTFNPYSILVSKHSFMDFSIHICNAWNYRRVNRNKRF
ncbi:hypothetical protein UACE39S_05293 [Ureibacillus acetophenoni]